MTRLDLLAVSSATLVIGSCLVAGYYLDTGRPKGLLSWISFNEEETSKPAPVSIEPGKGLVCTGSRDLRVEDEHIVSDGHAVEVLGSCDVTLIRTTITGAKDGIVIRGSGDVRVRDSLIAAGDTAIVIEGSGEVRLDDVHLSGGSGAISIVGSGDVEVKDSEVIGARRIHGSGEIKDRGGNTWMASGPHALRGL